MLECSICPDAIRNSPEYAAESKAEIAEENATDPQKHDEYMSKCVRPYEDSKNENSGERVAPKVPTKTSADVTAQTWNSFGYKKSGVLRPLSIYKSLEGKVPPKHQIQTPCVSRAKVRGVVRDPKHGS